MNSRYYVDRGSLDEWFVSDSWDTSASYIAYAFPIHSGFANWQVVLAKYSDTYKDLYGNNRVIFSEELFSVQFYSRNVTDAKWLVEPILDVLHNRHNVDINNPVELAVAFGGIVCHEPLTLPLPPISILH